MNTLRKIQSGTSGTLAVRVAIEQSHPFFHHDATVCYAKYGYRKIPHGPQRWPVIEGSDGVPVGLSTTIPGWGSTEYSAFTCPKQTDMPQSRDVQYYLAHPYITSPLDRQFLPNGYRALPEDHDTPQSGMKAGPSPTPIFFQTRPENAFEPPTTQ